MATEAIPDLDLAALPDDALAVVLGVLPPTTLAVARVVCKAWRDIIDGRELLRPHLLPRTVRGVFNNYIDHDRPHLFARPGTSSTFPTIDSLLSFLPIDPDRDWWTVLDHCSGVVLCNVDHERRLLVCNPATQRWTLLSGETLSWRSGRPCVYIAFDPTVSPHYEVFMIPDVPEKPEPPEKPKPAAPELDGPFCPKWLFSLPEEGALSTDDEDEQLDEGQGALSIDDEDSQLDEGQGGSSIQEDDQADNGQPQDEDPYCLMEWPPSQWSLRVFSSRTGLWEDSLFVREGQPAGTVENMRLDPDQPTWRGPRQRYAVYHDGCLYVHCRGPFIARFSLSTHKYQVIQMPTTLTKYMKPYIGGNPYLGVSMNAVHIGIVTNEGRQLRLWKLNELCGQIEWLLKYEADVGLYADYIDSLPYNQSSGRQPDGSWIVEESNEYVTDIESDDETQSEESIEWDSDEDDICTTEDGDGYYHFCELNILGFHPYKEVVFLAVQFGVVSYHLTIPAKVQYLGNSRPRCYYHNHTNGLHESFIYTPCMIGDLLHGCDLGDMRHKGDDLGCPVVQEVRVAATTPARRGKYVLRRRLRLSSYTGNLGCLVSREVRAVATSAARWRCKYVRQQWPELGSSSGK